MSDEDDAERLAQAVVEAQERLAARPHIFNPGATLFRGTMVGAISVFLLGSVGGVWGIAMAFSSFKSGAENTRNDVDSLRKELVEFKEEARRRRWSAQEMKWWAKAMRDQNAGKIVVPDPNDYVIER